MQDTEFGTYHNGKFILVKPLDECFDMIKTRVEILERQNAHLQEENNRLKSEKYKEEELAKMQKELEENRKMLMNGFPVSQQEKEKIEQWKEKHREKSSENPRSHSFVYEFAPTELGVLGTCICRQCRLKASTQSSGNHKKYIELLKIYDAEFPFSVI